MLNRADATKTFLTVALLAILLALSLSADFYHSSMVDAFMAMALGSAVVTLLVVQPSWTNIASVAVCSIVLAGLDYRVMGFQPRFMAAFSFAGLSGLAVLGARTIWARNQDRTLFLYAFLPAVLFVASDFIASDFLASLVS